MQRGAVGIALGARRGDLAARAIAGIDQTAAAQRLEGGGVVGEMLALPARMGLARDAEPR